MANKSDQCHQQVKEINDTFKGYMGKYLSDNLLKHESGEMTAEELLEELHFIEGKVQQGLQDLHDVKFPTMRERNNLKIWKQSLTEFIKAVGEIKKSLHTGKDRTAFFLKHMQKATSLSNKYGRLTTKTRIKGAS